jgi:hypothetical protein
MAALVLSACGSSSSGSAPSSLDPARVAPAGSVVYIAVATRPQGEQHAQIEAALHKLFGQRADAAIQRAANRLLARAGTSYNGGVQKWLGQRVALAITGLPTGGLSAGFENDVVLIAPTNDPGDARAFIGRAIKHSPGTTGGIVGRYAVFGGRAAVAAVRAAAGGGASLASTPSYRSAIAGIGTAPVAEGYVNLHGYLSALAALPQFGTLAPLLQQSMTRVGHGAAAFGVSMNAQTVSLDLAYAGVRSPVTPSSANVGSLPGNAWLAFATGNGAFSKFRQGLTAGFRLGLLGGLSRAGLSSAQAGAVAQRIAAVENQVLPALGPLSLSVAGTNPLAIQVGLEMKPASLPAASHLLGMLHMLAARQPSLQVQGGTTNFSVRLPTGSRAQVGLGGGRMVMTYGFPNQAAFLSPPSPLSGSAQYRQAVAQLPAGSGVPLYLDFAPITSIVQFADHSSSAAGTVATMRKLSYLILGTAPNHVRLVVGLA